MAIVLGLADTGYGIVRSLAERGIAVTAFESNRSRPEASTRLCDIVIYENNDDLLRRLLTLLDSLPAQPVLYLAGDALVNFFDEHQDILRDRVRIDFPQREVVAVLLDKTKFSAFAEHHGFLIPKTVVVQEPADLGRAMSELQFPVVVKPAWREANWKQARFPKVFVFSNREALSREFDRIYAVTNSLIVQEWIPGGDADIYFCLTYFDSQSNCLADFTGRKLRQWPVGTGSTACAEPMDETTVRDETIRLFRTIPFAGFGSVEFKRHARTGDFYIMEPTVGRPNHQSFIATANGVNMPGIAFHSLTGVPTGSSAARPTRPVIWVDDQFDMLSILVSLLRGRLNWRDLYRSYASKKSFRFFSSDIRPLIHVYLQAPYKLGKYVLKTIRNIRHRNF